MTSYESAIFWQRMASELPKKNKRDVFIYVCVWVHVSVRVPEYMCAHHMEA